MFIADLQFGGERIPSSHVSTSLLSRVATGPSCKTAIGFLGLPVGRPRELKDRKLSISAKDEPLSVTPDEGQVGSSRITVPV
jgi:hypothetical protein